MEGSCRYYWDSVSSSADNYDFRKDSMSCGYALPYACSCNRLHYRPPRTILVHEPEHWTDEDALAFIRLVNEETKTGFTVTMRIKGEILIIDPNIETRTMKDLMPLLRWYASRQDREKINSFFKEHPCIAAEE